MGLNRQYEIYTNYRWKQGKFTKTNELTFNKSVNCIVNIYNVKILGIFGLCYKWTDTKCLYRYLNEKHQQ